MKEMRLSGFGKSLMSRDIGEKVRRELLDMIEKGEKEIPISFKDVFMVSSSFADECLGKLIAGIGLKNFKECFVIKNLEDENIKMVVNRAIKQRLTSSK